MPPNEIQSRTLDFDAFPYDPYDIQVGFMQKLYETLDRGHVGLFESPTGTGKTMSLIVACLHWLEEYRKREESPDGQGPDGAGGEQNVCLQVDEDDEPDWMKSFALDLEKERRELHVRARAERLEKAANKLRRVGPGGRSVGLIGGGAFKSVTAEESRRRDLNETGDTLGGDDVGDDDAEFLLGGEDEDGNVALQRRLAGYLKGSSSSDDEDVLLSENEDEVPRKTPQVFFVSRTHSQLMQFVGELKKTRFHPDMSLISLASRKQLCINPDVLKLGSAGMINERCMDLQNDAIQKEKSVGGEEKKKIKKCRCPYLKRNSKGEQIMKDIMLSEALDIEDLARLGKKRGICPYYAAREASRESDIVLAPYSSLLLADTRESLGLDVKGSVIIVDEAHNLIDAINGGHSSVLSVDDISRAIEQIEFYFQRFKTRLSAKNAMTVQKLLLAAKSIASKGYYAGGGSGNTTDHDHNDRGAEAVVVTTNKFLFDTGLDNINMFQLGRDMTESKLIFKIGGYWKNRKNGEHGGVNITATTRTGQTGQHGQNSHNGSLQALIEFLKKLTYDNKDGRILVDRREKSLKYIMLNASSSFQGIVDEARSVVLASGTLSPLETIMPLFASKAPSDIERYSCDHIVDPNRLLAMAIPSGPSGRPFDFRHPNRSNPSLIGDLGRALINVSNVTPGGIVVFFPSFSYCEEVMTAWSKDGVMDRLKKKKDVFVEPRSASDVDKVLGAYSTSIEEGTKREDPACGKTGAVMLSVVGGKLAEGINFGDDMGRLVIMVGLPYPNPQDPELVERMRYLDSQGIGKDYYTNLCMKAVNQCIGRAIRHIDDYAAILLLDKRYVEQNAVSSKLSNWIHKSLRQAISFGEAQGRLVQFFRAHR
jgi:chromosome transmission fidelity protein 1